MTIAVVGSGAVGTWLAASLAAAGRDVVVCSRRPFDELVLDDRGTELRATVPVLTDPAQLSNVDTFFLATKAHQTAGAAAWLQGAATIVAAQNGVEHESRVSACAPDATVVPALVWAEVEPSAPGRAEHRGPGRLEVAPVGSSLAPLFEGTPIELQVVEDFVTAAWRKLCTNVAGSGITALTGRRLEVIGEPGVDALARGLVVECVAAGRAEGADLDASLPDTLVAGMATRVGGHTSMLHDRLAGHELEWEAIYGAVERSGDRHGIATPLTSMLVALLRATSGSRSARLPS